MKPLTDDEVREWQGHPVTEALQAVMRRQIEMRKRAMATAWFKGQPYPDADRVAVQMLEAWMEDFFHVTADEVREFMETDADDRQS